MYKIKYSFRSFLSSVADSGCIPDPDFCPSRIPDPTTATNEGGTLSFYPLYSHNFTELKIILCVNGIEKICVQLTKNYSTFYPKNCL